MRLPVLWKRVASCFESYQKVKETGFEVFGRSGGVARFSIAAFASECHGVASRTLNRGGSWKTSPRAVDRGFKRSFKLLKLPPGAPLLLIFRRQVRLWGLYEYSEPVW